MKSMVIAAILLTTVLASTLSAQNWPAFRGENASGLGDGQDPPITWDATTSRNILWKTPIAGLGHGSPIVWGEKLFIVTSINSARNDDFPTGRQYQRPFSGGQDLIEEMSKHSWKLYCLNKRTGKILWERTASEGIPKVKRHAKNTHASATPATDGKYVVSLFGSEGLYCYDLYGRLIWKRDLGVLDTGWFFDPDYRWGSASSPIIYKGNVIVQCDRQKDSFIAAFDLKHGREVWRTRRDEIPSWGTPTIFESKSKAMVVTNAPNRIRGYDPNTGKEIFELSGNPQITIPTPVVGHDMVFVAAAYVSRYPIYAIRPTASGDITLPEGKDSSEHIAWSKTRGGVYIPTPIVYGNYLYLFSDKGVLTSYDARTGELIYQQRVAPGGFFASPIAADGRLYFAGEDGDVFVVKAGPQYELLATNPIGEAIVATPAISEGMIFVRSLGHVYGIANKNAMRAKAGK